MEISEMQAYYHYMINNNPNVLEYWLKRIIKILIFYVINLQTNNKIFQISLSQDIKIKKLRIKQVNNNRNNLYKG